jgi:hypothetical protein
VVVTSAEIEESDLHRGIDLLEAAISGALRG